MQSANARARLFSSEICSIHGLFPWVFPQSYAFDNEFVAGLQTECS